MDQQPVKLVEGLYFLGKEGVRTVPAGVSNGTGLRIAVAGGQWDAQRWQESIGKEEGVIEGIMNPYMTSASIDRLLAHPSFQQPAIARPPPEDDEEPASLAAARALMAKRAEVLQKQSEQASSPPVDILLTSAWPSGITMFSDPDQLPHPTSRVWGAPNIAQLTRNAQPRYHFALAPGSCGQAEDETALGIVGLDGTPAGQEMRRTGAFWEREPFRTEGAAHPLCSVTRFISLARFANEKKQRWFMALNLAPAQVTDPAQTKGAASKIPANATISPFSEEGFGGRPTLDNLKRKEVEDDMQSGPNFRWTGNANGRAKKHQRTVGNSGGLPSKPNLPMPDRPNKVIPVGPGDCWFCLSNPQCAKHLIVAIGTECYVAMPKGQLPPTSNPLSPVPGGGHVLIIPIEHFPSLLGHPDPALARPIAAEMEAWRGALRKAYASFDASLVSWEICRTTGTRAGHMQSQSVPIPRRMLEGLEEFFRQAAVKYEYEMIEDQTEVNRLLTVSDSLEERQSRSDYFRLDLDQKTWLMQLHGKRFYLQFPRETLANFLGIPDRADWKRCARTEAIEAAETKAFKAAFEEYAEAVTE